MARQVRQKGIVVLQDTSIDLTATGAPTDIALLMNCPGDGCVCLDWALKIDTVGVGDGTHTVVLEHGLTTAGVAMSAAIAFLAVTEGVAETVHYGDGLGVQPTGGSLMGTAMQLQNTESGTNITTGAIVDVIARFLL
jgi:hypothetical protein